MLGITFDGHWQGKMMREEHLSKEELSTKMKHYEEWVLNLMDDLANYPDVKVKFYRYRTAFVHDEMFDVERDSLIALEYMLAIKAGARTDNHTVYEITRGKETIYVMCHDCLLRVGKTIEKGNW